MPQNLLEDLPQDGDLGNIAATLQSSGQDITRHQDQANRVESACSETPKLDPILAILSTTMPRLGGAESDEGITIFERSKTFVLKQVLMGRLWPAIRVNWATRPLSRLKIGKGQLRRA